MAIFSNNRFSNISVDDSELFNEGSGATMENSSTVSEIIDSVYENSGINLEDYRSNNFKYNGILESMINITENDNNLFSNILNMKFMNQTKNNTLNESGMDNNFERDKQNMIINNINKIYSGTCSSIAEEAKIVTEKLNKFFEKDAKVFNKYSPYVEMTLLENFEPIYIAFPTEHVCHIAESIANIDELSYLFNEAVDAIYEADAPDIMKTANDYKEKLNKIKESVFARVDEAVEEKEWVPTEESLDFIHHFVDPSVFTSTVNDTAEMMIESINFMKDNIFNDNYSTNVFSTINESDSVRYYAIADLSSAILKESLNRFNIYNNLVIREMANARKAMIVCGKVAIDELKETNTIDDVIIESICESSDIYVFDNFD